MITREVSLTDLNQVSTLFNAYRVFYKKESDLTRSTQFIKERIELLREENSDLRNQLKDFKEENERLRTTSSEMSTIVESLQKQPILRESTIKSLSVVEEKTSYLLEFNKDATESLRYAMMEFQEGISSMHHNSEVHSEKVYNGIREIEHVISRKERSNKEITFVLNELVEYIEESESSKRNQLQQIKNSARHLLDNNK